MSNETDPSRRHNRLSDPRFEEQGTIVLPYLFRRFDALNEAERSFTGDGNSALQGDDAATPYESVSDLVASHFAVAMDQLHAVKLAVESGREAGHLYILPMSMYTLIRSAFETIGTGIWLLSPSARDERVLRALQLTYDHRQSVHTVAAELGDSEDAGFDRMTKRVEQLRDARPGLRGRSVKKLKTVTDRLDSIPGRLPDLFLPPLTLWRMSSGLAHGNNAMIRSILEHEQVTDFRNGHGQFRLTSSVGVLAMFYMSALQMVEGLLALHALRNRALPRPPRPARWVGRFGPAYLTLPSCEAPPQTVITAHVTETT
jgi:hypothetical protein